MKKSIVLATACILSTGAIVHAVAPPPVTSESLYKQGRSAEVGGDPVAAQKFYEKALKANPNNADARYSLGQIKIHGPKIAAKGREAKFGAVMIPVFRLHEATLQEALDTLGVIIEKQSKETVTPNFVIEDPKEKLSDTRITLNLKAMPAKAVMKYLLEQSNTKVRYDEHAVVVTAK